MLGPIPISSVIGSRGGPLLAVLRPLVRDRTRLRGAARPVRSVHDRVADPRCVQAGRDPGQQDRADAANDGPVDRAVDHRRRGPPVTAAVDDQRNRRSRRRAISDASRASGSPETLAEVVGSGPSTRGERPRGSVIRHADPDRRHARRRGREAGAHRAGPGGPGSDRPARTARRGGRRGRPRPRRPGLPGVGQQHGHGLLRRRRFAANRRSMASGGPSRRRSRTRCRWGWPRSDPREGARQPGPGQRLRPGGSAAGGSASSRREPVAAPVRPGQGRAKLRLSDARLLGEPRGARRASATGASTSASISAAAPSSSTASAMYRPAAGPRRDRRRPRPRAPRRRSSRSR